MILFPNAKINIGLNIISKRADGYHNLESIFYPLAIKDALEVIEADELNFSSSGVNIPGNADDNLCLKAYHLLKKDFTELPPVSIHLHKHIPIGAGMGGGSSDASFFIRLVNQKFSLRMENSKMEQYASKIGSDCAFFIQNKPAYALEKGDQLSPLDLDLSNYFIVLVMPDVQVSTAEAYQGVRAAPVSTPLTELIKLPIEDWKLHIKNDFELSVFSKYPAIARVKAVLYESGALYASMSGSGSSVYGIFEEALKLPQLEKENKVYYV
ncbi:4-(cytidine 5'-diphospho)-2-C-methyl-D-erythritol kinase [Daejeonella sp.]|uniref:4-(cytidine 5'-diphospho)-2-C-methyl-D-erythritol kinase n=1 Tax=Daejeonella sp. TaxID=2805397 RepID=UPI00272F4CC2|nr:4-(cytidine 5'-diphospho)-2-C-methyl-D-erythritol kinase [Daejeonella sp.]MDP2412774.1 4-(cytidine 5'-diphospho)-2-C-methyl-D-erythritol kinase [Daejeonella sp.]